MILSVQITGGIHMEKTVPDLLNFEAHGGHSQDFLWMCTGGPQ
jgi:hypothetical protein